MAQAGANTGSQVTRPAQIPPAGWFQILKRTYAEATKDNVSIVGAGVAFYAFLAFVPLLAALVLTYGLVADPASVMGHIRGLTNVMPADAARLIGEQLISISQTATTKKGFGLLLALLLSLYGAMRGATSIITALNIVYGVEEDRGFVKTTLLAAMITVGAVMALILGMFSISVLGLVERMLPFSSPVVHTVLQILLWVVAAAGVSVVIALVYRYAPNRPKAKWAWLTPGSIVATLLWIAATLGFGFYVTNFGSYNATYGSLGAVVVFLTWLYLTAYILLMGGELNSELEKAADPASHPNPAS